MQKPTDGELEILRFLWEAGPSTVRAVNDRLNEQRSVGYTTTLKLMQIMFEQKGLLSRERQGKTHIYTALITEADTQQHLVQRLMDAAFSGSTSQLVMRALGAKRPSEDELAQIRAFLDTLDEADSQTE